MHCCAVLRLIWFRRIAPGNDVSDDDDDDDDGENDETTTMSTTMRRLRRTLRFRSLCSAAIRLDGKPAAGARGKARLASD